MGVNSRLLTLLTDLPYKFSMKAVLTSKGQITIPATIRKRLGLKVGQVLEFDEEAPYLKAVVAFDEDEMRSGPRRPSSWGRVSRVHFLAPVGSLRRMKSHRFALFPLSLAGVLGVATIAIAEPAAPIDPRVEAALAGSLLDVPAPDAAADVARPAADAYAPAGDTAGVAAAAAANVAEPQDPLRSSFSRFCTEWMQKLEARERRNANMIEWAQGTTWVEGSYVGYDHNHTCGVEAMDSPSPVGRLSYLEVKYERRGATVDDAMKGDAEAVETTEVTEFFRYGENGEWLY